MFLRVLVPGAVAVVVLVSGAQAQQPGVAVQLPTFSFFGVSTTVMVPDSGAGIAAAIKRARSARNLAGLPLGPKQAGIGRELRAAGLHVQATIIDHEELDQAVLAAAGRKPTQPANDAGLRLARATEESAGQAQLSLDEIRRRREAALEQRQQDGVVQFERGQRAEQAGKFNVARIYYQMAARRLGGELKEEALARLAALESRRAR